MHTVGPLYPQTPNEKIKDSFNLQVVESVDAKPKDMECPLYIY